jgi:hypothetical protein
MLGGEAVLQQRAARVGHLANPVEQAAVGIASGKTETTSWHIDQERPA